MNRLSSSISPVRLVTNTFLILALFILAQSGLKAATGVQVMKWKSLGSWQTFFSNGSPQSTYIAVEKTSGVMDGSGKVAVTYVATDRYHIWVSQSSGPRNDTLMMQQFLAAAPEQWFVDARPSATNPSVPYFALPRGLQVVASYPSDSPDWKYFVIGPMASTSLRFQLEPLDVSCEIGQTFELKVVVLGMVGPATVRWYKVTADGITLPLGLAEPLVGNTDTYQSTLEASDIGALYYVEVTDGTKTIRSKTAKVMRRAKGSQDILRTNGGVAISGRVWEDLNNNDTDNVEPGIPGVQVSLIDLDANRKIVASTTTDQYGNYEFVVVDSGRYRVNWKTSENYHVARPYIGDPAFDCDAEFASSLINAPTSSTLSLESGEIQALVGMNIQDIDLGLFAKPKLMFVETAREVIERDTDVVIEVGFVLSKPLRYTPLTLYFKTFSFPKEGATRLVDYRQENVTSTTVPAGQTAGVVRFTIVGDDLSEVPVEHFFVEPDQLGNKDHIHRDEKPDLRQVYIIDDDVKVPDPKDTTREYKTPEGNRIISGGTADFSTGAPMFWEPAPEIAINGRPAFKVGPANGLIAHAVMTSTNAMGPRTISFDWKMSGGVDDIMRIFTQDPNVVYDETNLPPVLGELTGTTGWQSISINLPAGHIFNLNIFKGGLDAGFIQGWVRNLNLGGADSPDTEETPEALALDGLEELQRPAAAEDRAMGMPSRNFDGTFSSTVLGSAGDNYQSGALSNLTVSTTGTVTGKVLHGGKDKSFRGNFDELGKYSGQVVATDGSTASLFLQMQTEVNSGAVQISGVVMDSNRNVARVLAQKPVKWVATINPCPYAGRYTLILPQRAGGAPDLPTGDGFATIVISQTGGVTLSGVLGDGVAFTAASSITPAGRIAVQKRLYSNKGGLTGVLHLRDVPGVSDLDGKLRWRKPANAKSIIHPEGFDVDVTSLGSKYNPALRPPLSLMTGAAPWFGKVEMAGGDFIKKPVEIETQLTIKGTMMSLREKAPPTGQKAYFLVRGTATLTNGTVTFTYEDKFQKKKTTCRGVLFQKQSTLVGRLSGVKTSGTFRLNF
ncbi:MAG: hypothetical protein JNJ83_24650 [Verrucomicrobiaceae bacterium]|nr:hypothetical protein [Verrucomicrobiaceae bacterium]